MSAHSLLIDKTNPVKKKIAGNGREIRQQSIDKTQV
jgi:hypothetical protein